jgi:hypothetical protein
MRRTLAPVLLFAWGCAAEREPAVATAALAPAAAPGASSWTERTPPAGPSSSPPARTGAAMAFDPVRRKAVLYGGLGAGGALQDT